MSRPIIDAGPSLNFFSTNQERLLFACVGRLAAPETVHTEIRRKSARDKRFAGAARILDKVAGAWFEELSDDETPELARAVLRMDRTPMGERMKRGRDLGELMVIAHAVVLAEAGDRVTVIIDEKNGQQMAQREAQRLTRMAQLDPRRGIGSIGLLSTERILMIAARSGYVADRGAMRALYTRLRSLDDGLVPIESTQLLSPTTWRRPEPGDS